MTENELNVTVTCITALATQPNANEKIKLLLTSLFESYSKEGFLNEPKNEETFSTVSAPLVFTQKEIEKMPKEFSKQFKVGKLTAHVRQKKNGVYEIYCQTNGVMLRSYGKILGNAKAEFIVKLNAYAKGTYKPKTVQRRGTNLVKYMEAWLEKAKKPFIKEVTYNDYYHSFKTYIKPAFSKKTLEELKHLDLQAFVNGYSEIEKHRTAKKLYQLLSSLFDYAVADGILPISPMTKVKLIPYEQEHGVPFTREEELELVNEFKKDKHVYKQAFIFMLYTGIRRAELASVEVEDGWVHIVTAKQRKGYKEKLRSLPIPPMLEEHMPYINFEEIKKLTPHILTKHLNRLCKNHHLHDLRHTFSTRAKECQIQREYISLWVGHKADNSLTSNVYIHLDQNKELQKIEMQKFQYQL